MALNRERMRERVSVKMFLPFQAACMVLSQTDQAAQLAGLIKAGQLFQFQPQSVPSER